MFQLIGNIENIQICKEFDQISSNDSFSIPFQYFPKVFSDNRGSFTEVIKENSDIESFPIINDLQWIKQINRSVSTSNVCRGMHAQYGEYCQSKLVECIYGQIYDIIMDARPNSKTFKKIACYKLDSAIANKLFVPIGFLHGFFSPDTHSVNIFQYYIGGNIYSREHEFSVNMKQILLEYLKDSSIELQTLVKKDLSNAIFSEKDLAGNDYYVWSEKILKDYNETGKLWYK